MIATMTPAERQRLAKTRQRLHNCEAMEAWHDERARSMEACGSTELVNHHRKQAAFYRKCRERTAQVLEELEAEFGPAEPTPVFLPPAGYQVIDDDGEMD